MLKRAIIELRADADKEYCQLRKKTTLQDVRSAVTKANTLKGAADEK